MSTTTTQAEIVVVTDSPGRAYCLGRLLEQHPGQLCHRPEAVATWSHEGHLTLSASRGRTSSCSALHGRDRADAIDRSSPTFHPGQLGIPAGHIRADVAQEALIMCSGTPRFKPVRKPLRPLSPAWSPSRPLGPRSS